MGNRDNIEIRKEYFKNGNLMSETSYIKGIASGIYREYFKTGELNCEIEFIDGLMHGEFNTYSIDGTLEEDTDIYFNGRLIDYDEYDEKEFDDGSKIKYYFLEGKLVFEIIYKPNGIKIEYYIKDDKPYYLATSYYKNGNLKSIFYYSSKGILDGIVKSYYDTGELREEYNYIRGILEGEFTIYYKNGYPKYKSNFLNGKLNGLKQKYSDNGKLIYEKSYSNGKEIG